MVAMMLIPGPSSDRKWAAASVPAGGSAGGGGGSAKEERKSDVIAQPQDSGGRGVEAG